MKNLKNIQAKFKNKKLFDQALTHRSWVNENFGKRTSNERLEFLGDAVLELVVTDFIFTKLQEKEEGELTALRANIVNTTNLAKLAQKMQLGENIFLSKGEQLAGGRENKSLLADTTEALIGAIYLDQGIDAASKFIQENLLDDFDNKIKEPLKDPKSRLQEYMQASAKLAPKYKVIKTSGPDHAKEFTVQVQVQDKILGIGKGKSKSEAQQQAAMVALETVSG